MSAIAPMLKSAINALNDTMRGIGKQINASEIEDIVKEHSAIGAASGIAAAALPGAGPLVASGVALTSIVAMYVRLSKSLGVSLERGILKAIASAVVADISTAVLGNIAISTALSFVPVGGQVAATVIIGAGNYGMVYLAALIFIKMLAALLRNKKDISKMSADELIKYAKETSANIDKKAAVKEAKSEYKKEKNNNDTSK